MQWDMQTWPLFTRHASFWDSMFSSFGLGSARDVFTKRVWWPSEPESASQTERSEASTSCLDIPKRLKRRFAGTFSAWWRLNPMLAHIIRV